MSQAGEIDVIGNHPEIPTEFVANVGTAVPIANTIEILGASVAAGSIPVETVASGNTLTVQVQTAQEIVATDATKIGLAAFDSAGFDVDANGFVTLTGGGGATTNIDVDAHTAPGTDPVVPNAGNITLTGAQVASGIVGTNVIRTDSLAANTITIEIQRSTAVAATDLTKNGVSHFNSAEFSVDANGFVSLLGGGQAVDSIGTQTGTNPITPTAAGLVTINGAVVAAGTNPVRSDGTGANTMAIEVQISQALAATDATKIGLCNFNSAQFAVDANGFVSLAGGGLAIDSITPNSGTTPIVPDSNGNVSLLGTGSITVVGSLNTGTIQLTGLTNHAIQIGAGTATLTQLVAGTTGQVLQTNTGADPTWSTATYPSTTTANQILYSNANNTVTGLPTANNSILSTDGSGVPSLGTSLSNDYTFTSATSGATRTLTVSNTSDTASSAATIVASTAGSTAGDAKYQATTTATTWSWGADNSVTSPTADPFVISQGIALGTNNVMSIATSGEINYPLQSCFSATANTQNNVTGDGTAYTGIFANEIFDQNNDFDGTSTFTAPVTGRYTLHVTIQMNTLNASMTVTVINIVTSNRTYVSNPGSAAMRDANNNSSFSFNVIADMDTGDTATINYQVFNATKVASLGSASYFMGTLTA